VELFTLSSLCAIFKYEEGGQKTQAENPENHCPGRDYRPVGIVRDRGLPSGAVSLVKGCRMNTLLLVAFGLVALGSILRLILFFTRPKDSGNAATSS
jgi:hypothetical protein